MLNMVSMIALRRCSYNLYLYEPLTVAITLIESLVQKTLRATVLMLVGGPVDIKYINHMDLETYTKDKAEHKTKCLISGLLMWRLILFNQIFSFSGRIKYIFEYIGIAIFK